jgi:hypothetical protein
VIRRRVNIPLWSLRRARSLENIETVRELFVQNPHMSTRRAANALPISRSSIQRILKEDLKFHPYKLQHVQELKPQDLERRVEFTTSQLGIIRERPDYPFDLLMSDEANFHTHGGVNNQNFRYWSPVNPHWYSEEPLNPEGLTVWMGVGAGGVVGPYFYEGVTVNGQRYGDMLDDFVLPIVEVFDNFDTLVWMQDGATPHFGGLEWCDENFPDRWMGRGTRRHPAPYAWPPRSPDLTWMDYFWWGYLKGKLYTDHPYPDLESLKEAIEREVEAVPEDMVERAVMDYERRLQVCIDRGGRSVETR